MRLIHTFNRIYVIESLPSGKTGQALFDHILMWAHVRLGTLKSKLFQPASIAEFLQALAEIEEHARTFNTAPIIHIEAHGDKNGIMLANGERLDWENLYAHFVAINISCRNSLFLVMAVCEGAYLGKIISLTRRAPFWGLLGPDAPVSSEDLYIAFSRFYEEMFRTLDGTSALKALNAAVSGTTRYVFLNSRKMFEDAWVLYEKEYCMGKGRLDRVDRILTRQNSALPNPSFDITRARKIIKKRFKETRGPIFSQYMRLFFMIDLYPENAEKFQVYYPNVLRKAQK